MRTGMGTLARKQTNKLAMLMLAAALVSCGSVRDANAPDSDVADSKAVIADVQSGQFALTIPGDLFNEAVAKVAVSLTGAEDSYQQDFGPADDVRLADLVPGQYDVQIDLYLGDLSLIDYTGQGQVTIEPQAEARISIELRRASMNGSVDIEITVADGDEPPMEIKTAVMRPYQCFDLEADAIVPGDDFGLDDCYGRGYDFYFAWNGNISRPAFFFNEQYAEAQILDKDFADVTASDVVNLCGHLNDPGCGDPSWTMIDSVGRTAVIRTEEGNLYKVALTQRLPVYSGVEFRYQRLD